MSQQTATKTYDVVGNREDLTDIITNITPYETPIFNSLEKTKAKGTYHEWETDTLSTANDNAHVESENYSYNVDPARTRMGNYTQIFTKTASVSETQQAVDTAGVEDEFAYQMEKRMKEIATDIEYALINGPGASGASATARRLKGILAYIATNVESGTGTAAAYFTEDRYNTLLQQIWENGGRPKDVYVKGFQKRVISKFSTPTQRFQDMGDSKKLVASVDIYSGDFGVQEIHYEQFANTDKVMVLQKDLWKVAVLRGIKTKNAPEGLYDAKAGALVGELTMESRNEVGSGKSINLLTS